MVQRPGHYDGMSKNDWKHLRCGMEKDGACKMDRQNKKCSCARKGGRRKNNAGKIRKRKRNWLGHWLRRNCLLKDALQDIVNGKKVRGRRNQMIRQHYEKWTV